MGKVKGRPAIGEYEETDKSECLLNQRGGTEEEQKGRGVDRLPSFRNLDTGHPCTNGIFASLYRIASTQVDEGKKHGLRPVRKNGPWGDLDWA